MQNRMLKIIVYILLTTFFLCILYNWGEKYAMRHLENPSVKVLK